MAGRVARGIYSSRAWQIIRYRVLQRDGWRCRKCGQAGRLEVDHIKSVADGGAQYAEENLQSLCRGCHIEKTSSENRGKKRPFRNFRHRRVDPPERAAWDRLVEAL